VTVPVATVGRADVRLPIAFGDHMVLQQGRPLPVWGSAEPGERVRVRFGDAQATAVTGSDGRWQVVLPPQAVSASGRPLVAEGRTTVTLDDVVVGEVWLCAGQSNMLFPLAKAAGAADVIAASADPLLRLLPISAAAGGDPPAYSAAEIATLRPGAFTSGTWAPSSPAAARGFSAVGFFFARRLRAELGVPVGVIQFAVGGSPTEAWIDRGALAACPATARLTGGNWLDSPLFGDWCRGRAVANLSRAVAAGEPVPGDDHGPNHPFKPGFLWTAGIEPLAPVAIAGVCWYQGESNAETAELVTLHDELFPVLVRAWRRAWGRDDLPFAVVQLPGMGRPHWPAFRDGQRRLQASLPHTGLAVTIDLGAKGDVHPRDKRPVGERLAGWALAEVYARGDAGGSSPLPVSAVRLPDGRVRIVFAHAGAGLQTSDGGPPRHVEAAGVDGAFHPAEAAVAGDALVLAAAADPIRRVRYAWQPWPDPPVNLLGAGGLPVTPFELEVTADATP
jgi:sialate O-acetylesterase